MPRKRKASEEKIETRENQEADGSQQSTSSKRSKADDTKLDVALLPQRETRSQSSTREKGVNYLFYCNQIPSKPDGARIGKCFI